MPRADGLVCVCVDFRKVNVVRKFVTYLMPCIDELLDQVGTIHFYSTLDLAKGQSQIALTLVFLRNCFFHSVWVMPVVTLFLWVVWRLRNISTSHGQIRQPICICLCSLR